MLRRTKIPGNEFHLPKNRERPKQDWKDAHDAERGHRSSLLSPTASLLIDPDLLSMLFSCIPAALVSAYINQVVLQVDVPNISFHALFILDASDYSDMVGFIIVADGLSTYANKAD